ncbi:hypothetical protein BURPS1710b_2483 [Burkholderia pseudomallei 1710b]|uniref:Uncharacterized protein n=1 Tax=Burkholderia pseudomallei (strain 1710b) TaxID=320372 RepID=Q3JRC8_BURP1|nr:hypothetical protein BURPS1710b_2483 [Burkholderia pseudomallei 1710b]
MRAVVAPTAGTPLERHLCLRRRARQCLEAYFLIRHLRLAQHEIDDVALNDERFHFGKALLIGIIPADHFLRVLVALREFVDFRANLLGLRLEAVRLHQLGEHEAELHAALGLIGEHLGRNRRVLRVRHAALREVLTSHLDEALLILLDERLRHVELGNLQERVHHLVLHDRLRAALRLALEVLLDLGAHLRQIAVLDAERLREIGVDLGQVRPLDLLQRDRELRGLARHILAVVIVRELQVEFARLARLQAERRRLEFGQHPPFAEHEHEVFRRAALERDAVDLADEIHRHAVAVLRGRVRAAVAVLAAFAARVEMHALLAQDVERAVDLGVADRRRRALDFSRRQIADLHFRIDLERRVERVGALLLRVLFRREARLTRDAQVFRTADREEFLTDLVAQHLCLDLARVLLRDHLERHLARAEARHAHVLREFLDTGVDLLLHDILRQGDRHTAFELAEVFNNVSHGFNRPKIIRANRFFLAVPALRRTRRRAPPPRSRERAGRAQRPAARAAHASHRRLEARLWPEESAILANYFLLTASSDGAAPQQRRTPPAASDRAMPAMRAAVSRARRPSGKLPSRPSPARTARASIRRTRAPRAARRPRLRKQNRIRRHHAAALAHRGHCTRFVQGIAERRAGRERDRRRRRTSAPGRARAAVPDGGRRRRHARRAARARRHPSHAARAGRVARAARRGRRAHRRAHGGRRNRGNRRHHRSGRHERARRRPQHARARQRHSRAPRRRRSHVLCRARRQQHERRRRGPAGRPGHARVRCAGPRDRADARAARARRTRGLRRARRPRGRRVVRRDVRRRQSAHGRARRDRRVRPSKGRGARAGRAARRRARPLRDARRGRARPTPHGGSARPRPRSARRRRGGRARLRTACARRALRAGRRGRRAADRARRGARGRELAAHGRRPLGCADAARQGAVRRVPACARGRRAGDAAVRRDRPGGAAAIVRTFRRLFLARTGADHARGRAARRRAPARERGRATGAAALRPPVTDPPRTRRAPRESHR